MPNPCLADTATGHEMPKSGGFFFNNDIDRGQASG